MNIKLKRSRKQQGDVIIQVEMVDLKSFDRRMFIWISVQEFLGDADDKAHTYWIFVETKWFFLAYPKCFEQLSFFRCTSTCM